VPAVITTTLLYLGDPLLTRFTARVSGHGPWRGAVAVTLDRTAFYPEAGGQMPDHSVLGGARVVDVQVGADGAVRHVLAPGDAPPDVGSVITGELDVARRRDAMSHHTGQHMLSQALLVVSGARTVSSRLGETVCTVDVDVSAVAERDLLEAEALVSSRIDDDLEVRVYVPLPDELARLRLRRRPKVDRDVRVVDIGGFDITPCGGTHCTHTSQVGVLSILGAERHRGKTRVTFVAGARARALLGVRSRTLAALGRDFSCAPLDVPLAIDALRRGLLASTQALGTVRDRLAEQTARALVAAAPAAIVTGELPGADIDLLRAVGKAVAAHPERAALLAAVTSDATHVLASRGDACDIDCGALVRALAAAAGGRGGGRPDHAEGRLAAGVDWPALVARVLADQKIR